MSQDYQATPAEIMGVSDPLAAVYFNRAVYAFGSRLESELARIDNSNKSEPRKAMMRNMVYTRWLGDSAGRFARR